MSARTKKPRIRGFRIIVSGLEEKEYKVPLDKAKALMLLLNEFEVRASKGKILADDIFKKIDKKYSRPGAALQGARLKAEMSQVQLAEKLGVNQSDLSKMEHGKRPIGRKMAKRLAHALNIDYRVFL